MLLVLAAFEGVRARASNPLLVFGRVPLFYYLLHLPLLHAVAVALAQWRTAGSAFMLVPPPSLRGPRPDFPTDYGYDLWVVYLVWVAHRARALPRVPLVRRPEASGASRQSSATSEHCSSAPAFGLWPLNLNCAYA